MLSNDDRGTMHHQPNHFFYGATEITRQERATRVVDMIKNTNDVTINIVDKTPSQQGTRAVGAREMEFTVTFPLENDDRPNASNGTIRHDNSIDGTDTRPMTHIATLTKGQVANTYTTTVTVGRLFEGDRSRFTLIEKETGKSLLPDGNEVRLTDETIRRLRSGQLEPQYAAMEANEYLDKQDKYNFYYEMSLVHNVLVVAEISVHDWNKVQQGGQEGILW
jgi:hypothetical protein